MASDRERAFREYNAAVRAARRAYKLAVGQLWRERMNGRASDHAACVAASQSVRLHTDPELAAQVAVLKAARAAACTAAWDRYQAAAKAEAFSGGR